MLLNLVIILKFKNICIVKMHSKAWESPTKVACGKQVHVLWI
jgi:hypothetical protein